MSANNWCTIESDPGVFTELIQEMGVTGVQVEELYQLDKEFMDGYAPVYGLVFLFKWRANERDDRVAEQEPPPGVFFASQVINNACATQAILSILLNTPDINLGHELVNFKTFTKDFPPQLKGLAISNSDLVRKAHNSFARAEPFIMTGRTAEKDDELFHFISYVPIDGKLYELDGLKPGPICLGECSDEDWLAAARPEIAKRIERYSAKEIRFNLMAIIKNRAETFQEEQASLERERDRTIGLIQSRGASLPTNDELETMLDRARAMGVPTRTEAVETGMEASVTPDEMYLLLSTLNEQLTITRGKIRIEEDKFLQWKIENVRRKHNYVPFVLNFISLLAKKRELMPLVEKSKQKPRTSA
mmetsp:Transcript_10371/g.26107  ORF Transcript_10371/g.26107 Transcript_10371/m.26107 type:complete len:361 (-) Transcript_10371:168-1250(-)